ncbi:MAG: presqualene diphosphate synthase HpnD [Geminicoccaceae bacterium]
MSAAAIEHVEQVVRRSGTSFYWAMRLLPRARRQGMYAVYAFCREVDDVADEPGSLPTKLRELAAWRNEIGALYAGRPTRPTTMALLEPVRAFDLPRAEFEALVDGMEMDATEAVQAPDLATLRLYCRRVAGAVGLLSIRIFGAHSASSPEFAVATGEALQLTNILRDLDEDAQRGRLYVPHELLDQAGIATRDPEAVLAHPRFPDVCAALAELAAARFADAERLRRGPDARALRPAVLMMKVYEQTLARLRERGFHRLREPIRVSGRERAWIALRHSLLQR